MFINVVVRKSDDLLENRPSHEISYGVGHVYTEHVFNPPHIMKKTSESSLT